MGVRIVSLLFLLAVSGCGADDFAPPEGLVLEQSIPNPTRDTALIHYSLDRPSPVTLVIYDAAGRRVREVRRGDSAAGPHSYRWDGRDQRGRRVAAGTYFYAVEAAGARQAKKLVILN